MAKDETRNGRQAKYANVGKTDGKAESNVGKKDSSEQEGNSARSFYSGDTRNGVFESFYN